MADSFVSNAIQFNHTNDTDTLYAVVRNVAGQIRDVVNSEWDSHPASGSLDDYDISAGTASGGLWVGDFPNSTACPPGYYIVQLRKRASATPDFGDRIVGAQAKLWNGAVFGSTGFSRVVSAGYVGDYIEDEIIYFLWYTPVPTTADGTIKVYKNNGTGEVTAPTGITDTRNFDSTTGVHLCIIDLSANTFYQKKKDYSVVLNGATIDGETVNAVIATFSIEQRYAGVEFEKSR